MDILVADKLDAKALQDLKDAGFGIAHVKGLPPGGLGAAAPRAEILIVRSTPVASEILAELPALKLIIRAGAGVDTIDVPACSVRGIQVSNCPGRNADAVAEMALALLLAADRRLVEATQDLRQGRWTKGALGQGVGLKGRTLGIVGFGFVGQAMARKAKGLDMKILAWSRSLSPAAAAQAGVGFAGDLETLARASDAVTLHVSSTAETRNFIGKGFFSALKPGALFVNTSRGEIVDRVALIEAIRNQGLRVGLDVFAGEPNGAEAAFPDVELAALAVCSPHLGASTDQASDAVSTEVARIAIDFRVTGQAPNRVSS